MPSTVYSSVQQCTAVLTVQETYTKKTTTENAKVMMTFQAKEENSAFLE